MKNFKKIKTQIQKQLADHGKAVLNGFIIVEGTGNTNLMATKPGEKTVFCNTVEEILNSILKMAEACEECGERLLDENVVWLELSQTDGKHYKTIPHGHTSQGSFAFGKGCATKVLAGQAGE
ncbi:MAG: hypothetical protein ABJH04_08180 [Cyclobacteriaceae bacterium]